QQWEYKVGMVSVKGTDVMIGDSLEDEKAKKIAALGADGWEYAGPMPIWDSDWSNSVVVFKRPKK
ncbi:MAG TPA: DUF4177 domain-containing protein, partial [Gemmataceae bacterium]|nr:DUF4177 domain-containing protein [Gemmataceae bacterium]